MTISKEGIEGATQKGLGAVKEAGSAKEAVRKTKDAIYKATI